MRDASGKAIGAARALAVGGVSAAVVAAMIVPAGAAPAGAVAAQSTQHIIVVLRNQHTDLTIAKGLSSPRVKANHDDEAPLLSQVASAGGKNAHGFDTLNGVAATVTPAEAAQLAADPSVAAVYPDLPISAAPSTDTDKPSTPTGTSAPANARPQSSPVCPSDPSHPLLEPEALGVTNTDFSDTSTPQAHNIVDGTGVKVAFIADGLDINNPDFIRADSSHVFVDYQDFSGEGPNAPVGAAEAFGDASSIAAQGRQTYDLANFVNAAHPLPPGCTIRIQGVAPGASLIGLKVFGNSNTAPTSRFIQAIDYAVTDGADVINESFGANPFPDNGNDPITLADEAAIAAGVAVVASTGDAGTTGTIGSPASAPDGLIGVGATTTFQSYIQDTFAGAQLSNGSWISNNISGLSSGGVTQSGGVPDLVAPGDLGWALCTPNLSLYEECTDDSGNPSPIQNFGGTSQSSPLTAGTAALVIEAYENTHHGVRPTPALVKQLLTSTATDLGVPAYEQGSGLLNSLAAVLAAESWSDGNGSPSRQGIGLVVNKTQLRLSGNPALRKAATLAVTNTSNAVQTVHASTRSFEHVVSTVHGMAALDAATAPTYLDSFGIQRSFVSKTFTVGSNVDRLDVSEATASSPFASRIILIDPSGAYAAYSIPQGAANYAHIDVRFPMAGTWTAFFALSKSSGFNGTFAYSVVQTDVTAHGVVVPSMFVLGPGQSTKVTVVTQLPLSPGDLSASVQFAGSRGATSVPMTLRAEIPPTNFTFSGKITGGNGRQAGGVAQSNIYFLHVRPGTRDLSIGFTFSDPGQLVLAFLTAPDGQVYSFHSNVSPDETQLLNTIQLYRRNPGAGRWILSLEITNPVSGLEVTQRFTAKVAYNTVNVSAAGLPNNAKRKLAQGVPVTIPVTVKNTGVAPLVYFADPRLSTVGAISLAELSGVSQPIPLPVPDGVVPLWLVPTETTSVTAAASADQPVNLDFFYQSGEPDVYSAANGNGASVTERAAQVSPGVWEADVGQSGPFAGPAPAGSLNLSASVVGRLFDPAVTSSTGDFWQVGVDPASNAAMAARVKAARAQVQAVANGTSASLAPSEVPDGPLVLNPGQTGTMTVTITPTAASGTVVKGNVYIDAVDLFVAAADEVVALPYSYTVG
jgi:hypothetical protein